MITVIVPVYNTESYLEKCVDSILAQSYADLEILLIDDGSTDRSAQICDEYEKRDSRIRVIRTENRGLSEARNRGLDEAKGEWIGFVDSDDWIDPDMYECLLRRALETGADIAECGIRSEQPSGTVAKKRKALVVCGEEAVRELLQPSLSNVVWDKLYKKSCFETIRFPADRLFEDVAVTYRLLMTAGTVCTVEDCKYNHLQRQGSLSLQYSMKNLAGYWLSHKERYDFLKDKVGAEENKKLRKVCARAAARTWAHYHDCEAEERKAYAAAVGEMNRFVRQCIPLFGERGWDTALRIGVFFPHFNNSLSFCLSRMLLGIRKKKTADTIAEAES
ncbi:MAG: glycosyltransferase family 2 protein [Lachnospiraceae bacterium]|nr:glycosyltransferase family 2 protein [Lachnospiraceae bacterium]